MKEAAQAVIDFNTLIIKIEPRPIGPMSDAEFRHLHKCLREEFSDEFYIGHINQDVIQMADALLDGMYFALGGLYKMGLNAEQIRNCFMAIHEANMTKKSGIVEKRAIEGANDAVKPSHWISPETQIAGILGLTGK